MTCEGRLTAVQAAKCRLSFHYIDQDADGLISGIQFYEYNKRRDNKIGTPYNQAKYERAFDRMDVSRTGKVSFDQYAAQMALWICRRQADTDR